MLQRLVANWLRQQAQEAVMQSLHPDESQPADKSESGTDVTRPDVDIVVIFPSANEAGGFVDKLLSLNVNKCHGFTERIGVLETKTICVVEAPADHEKLTLVVRDVLSLHKPSWMLACGFAVGLDASVRSGDIVVANSVIDETNFALSTGTKMPESKGLRVGTLLTRKTLPTQGEKKTLAARETSDVPSSKTLACETQAAIVAEVSRVLKTPMMSVHVVAQGLQERPSDVVEKLRSQESLASMLGAAAGALLDQPGSVKDIWRDKESALRLSDRLAGFLVGVVAQLPAKTKPD